MSLSSQKRRTYISREEAIGVDRIYKLRKIRPLVDNFTPISEVPRAWLQTIEPKIKRMPASSPAGGCWVWQGAVDREGHPVMSTIDLEKRRGLRRVARWVASFFYDFPPYIEVTHHCENVTCIRPSHLELQPTVANQRIAGPITHLTPLDVSYVRAGIDDRRKRPSQKKVDPDARRKRTRTSLQDDDFWITVRAAIKLMGIGRASFYRYRAKGLIKPPVSRDGPQRLYVRSYIQELAKEMEPHIGPERERGRGYGWGV
jgi:hypothetical protein